jgi:hypothetical protein
LGRLGKENRLNNMINDQIFKAGDKVVFIGMSPETKDIGIFCKTKYLIKGNVYCVRDCWKGWNGYHAVSIVGIPDTGGDLKGYGWLAADFRKVEEVKQILQIYECKEVTQPAKKKLVFW